MKVDFSSVNLQNLIHIRYIAREDPKVAAPRLGMSSKLGSMLAQAPSEHLTKITWVKAPLVAARSDAVWWIRLFKALIKENLEEVEADLQGASLAVLSRIASIYTGNSEKMFAVVPGLQREASSLGNIEAVNQARNTFKVVRSVQMGAWAALVCLLTGLTSKAVNGLYPPLTGMPSWPGQEPLMGTRYVKSNRRLLRANRVWHLFQHLQAWEHEIRRAGLSKTHGLRHSYAQRHYGELTARKATVLGDALSKDPRRIK